jgi:hypothetical protein
MLILCVSIPPLNVTFYKLHMQSHTDHNLFIFDVRVKKIVSMEEHTLINIISPHLSEVNDLNIKLTLF